MIKTVIESTNTALKDNDAYIDNFPKITGYFENRSPAANVIKK